MGRQLDFDFRRGGGGPTEILYGTVTLEPTARNVVGTSTVLPDPTEAPLVNGLASIPDAAISPDGPTPAWCYRVTVKAKSGSGWSYLVGIPVGAGAINFKDLPLFDQVGPGIVPTLVGQITDPNVAALITNPGTTTGAAVKTIADASASGKLNKDELAILAPAPGGTDDTAALQATIDQASASTFTRRVTGRTGVYVVSQVTVPAGVTLANITIKHKAASTLAAVRLNGAGATLDNVEIDGNAANQTSSVNGVEVNATRCAIARCYVHDTKFKGVAITTNGTYAIIRGNNLYNTGAGAIDNTGGSWATISGNTINTTGAAGIGVSSAAIGVAVTGNTIRFSTLDGVVAYESTLRELSIVGNTIESPGNHGVHVGGSGLVVANNTIKDVLVGSGVFCRNHDSTTATDVAFTGNTVRGAVMSGARVELATNATVTGNSFTDCNDGVFVDGCTNVTATGNTIKNARATGARVNATQNVTFTGNVLESSQFDAVYFLTCGGVAVVGNTIAGTTGGRGLRLYRTERATVSGNTFRNIFSEAVYGFDTAAPATPSKYITVVGNVITTAGAGIVSGENSDYWTLSANTFAGVTGSEVTLVGTNNKTFSPATTPANLQYAPTGALATTMDRRTVGGSSIPVVASGTMRMTAVWLAKGTVVTSLTYLAGTVGVSVTNRWFALYDISKNLLRTTADNAAAWAAGATLTLPLASTYTVPSDGLYYIGICEVATTTTALRGIAASSNAIGISPPINGDGSTGLTNAASTPTPGPALTVSGNLPYAYVS